MKIMTILILTFLSFQAFSQESDELYQQLLNKHLEQGQLNRQEFKSQEFQYANQKSLSDEFKEQVRGVASTFQSRKEIIKLKNPVIEIPVE